MSELLTKQEKNALLRTRAAQVKAKLKGVKGWKIDFCEKNPEYNSARWVMIINNVVNGYSVDEDLTSKLELYVESLTTNE